jgi:hypothetical protein
LFKIFKIILYTAGYESDKNACGIGDNTPHDPKVQTTGLHIVSGRFDTIPYL